MDGRLVVARRFGLYRASAVVLPGNSNVSLRLPTRSKWNRDLFATAAVYGWGLSAGLWAELGGLSILCAILHQRQSTVGYCCGFLVQVGGWVSGLGWVADRRESEPSKRGNCGLRRRAGFSCFSLRGAWFCALSPLREVCLLLLR